MSDELTLIDRIVEFGHTDSGIEHALVIAMRGVGHRIVDRPNVARALIVADQLRDGYVIASEEQAAEVADLVAQVIDGERDLTEQTWIALRIPKAMEAAVRESVGMVKDRLARARQTGNTARVTWQATVRRRAAEEEEKARLAAQEAARIATEKAAETGEDAPPMAEVAPVEVPRVVSGGQGRMGLQARIDVGEIADWSQVPRDWLTLVPATARAFFQAAERAGQVKRAAPGETVVFKGVAFHTVESAVNRR